MNWYIGQEIVAIRNHRQGVFKKGDTFTIKSLRGSRCNCGGILIDIGVNAREHIGLKVSCDTCRITYVKDNIWWMHESNFYPIDFDISELTDILNNPIEQINL